MSESALHRLCKALLDHPGGKRFLASPKFIVACYDEAIRNWRGPMPTTPACTTTLMGHELLPDDAVPYGELVEYHGNGGKQ